MLDYDQRIDEAPGARTAPQGSLKVYLSGLAAAIGLAARHKGLIVASALVCALAGFGLSKTLTPRYVASAQIYIDPHGLPGVDKDGTPPNEDSNGFINFVESQSLIVTSRLVLERVVANEKLDRDDEFGGGPSLWGRFFGGPSPGQKVAEESLNGAVAALASKITVHRPERTFIIDVSVKSRDPDKAARLANAVANAFIEVQSSMRSDSARQAKSSLTGRLETLRAQLIAAEKKVEDFRAENGLVGTREQTVTEQQLRDMNQQITLARTKVEEARSRYDQIQAARTRGGDIGAIAIGLNLASLTPLRAQQAEARQRLADLSTELGPLHPLVKDATARVAEANRAVDAELARVAQSAHSDYSQAKDFEASLNRQLEALKQQTLANDQTSVALHDLQREADAARSVYDLFVTRSRQTGDIQQVDADAPNIRIVSLATPPKERSFPPSASLLGGAGLIVGLAAGLGLALLRERRYGTPALPAPREEGPPLVAKPVERPKTAPILKPKPAKPAFFNRFVQRLASAPKPPLVAITERSLLERRERRQSVSRIDLTALGFATLQRKSDNAEFRKIFDAFGMFEALKAPGAGGRSVVVAGSNDSGLRTALAINLALTAASAGCRVALVDAASRNAKLTRAVREATTSSPLTRGVFFETVNKILLALPKGYDESLGRMRPAEVLRYLKTTADEDIDIVIADGPDATEAGADLALDEADDIVLIDAVGAPSGGDARSKTLSAAADKLRVMVRFDGIGQPQRKIA